MIKSEGLAIKKASLMTLTDNAFATIKKDKRK